MIIKCGLSCCLYSPLPITAIRFDGTFADVVLLLLLLVTLEGLGEFSSVSPESEEWRLLSFDIFLVNNSSGTGASAFVIAAWELPLRSIICISEIDTVGASWRVR